jgi:hypothetical protein
MPGVHSRFRPGSRVPRMYQATVILGILVILGYCEINKLHVFSTGRGFKSPSPHHKNPLGVISLRLPFFRVTPV